ncbi:hypothetical protein H6F46_02505 [Limnothrix sp. FACHB-1083]|uniref:hypothetical protein n=1 Tax=unclassified Limnothrix TaxID=2632864 RepID=UPI00167FF363|nr:MULTISPECIES: hypothetical protein [unclassified Limnothrix]MBD2159559.1 hypothetical protein [Limnothrix sp. FACHB-1083]MBD2190261.1 hypothetical protein [Limnothrix sp. FACHB-1088]
MSYWRWLRAVCWMAMHDRDFQHRGLVVLLWPIEWSGSISDESVYERNQAVWLIQGYLTVRWPQLWIRRLYEMPGYPHAEVPDADYDEIPF